MIIRFLFIIICVQYSWFFAAAIAPEISEKPVEAIMMEHRSSLREAREKHNKKKSVAFLLMGDSVNVDQVKDELLKSDHLGEHEVVHEIILRKPMLDIWSRLAYMLDAADKALDDGDDRQLKHYTSSVLARIRHILNQEADNLEPADISLLTDSYREIQSLARKLPSE